MSVTFIFVVLVIISAVTYLLMSAAKLYLQSLNWKRSSETVINDRSAIEADARPSEVVNHAKASDESDVVTIKESATDLQMENHASNSQPVIAQTDVMLPTSPEEWSKFDEPACRRRPGSFVIA